MYIGGDEAVVITAITRTQGPPISWVNASVPTQDEPIVLSNPQGNTWTGYDAVSGVAGFDVEYTQDSQGWTGWFTNTIDTETIFVAEAGQTYTFRVTSRDRVGNVSQAESTVQAMNVVKYYVFNG